MSAPSPDNVISHNRLTRALMRQGLARVRVDRDVLSADVDVVDQSSIELLEVDLVQGPGRR